MITAANGSVARTGVRGLLAKTVARVLRVPEAHILIDTKPHASQEVPPPDVLSFFVGGSGSAACFPMVQAGDEITAGQPLVQQRGSPVLVSPVHGSVRELAGAADPKGGARGTAILVEPALTSSPGVFEALGPEAPAGAILERLRDAAVPVFDDTRRLLVDVLSSGRAPSALIVSAVDAEPSITVAAQLLAERLDDTLRAARLLGRAAQCERVVLAVPAPADAASTGAAKAASIDVLEVPPRYPHTLTTMIARSAPSGAGAATVVPVEAALAARRAVESGAITTRKRLTFIPPNGAPPRNLEVALGARLDDLLAALGVELQERDTVVAGGPMRGVAQCELDASVHAGMDALMVLRRTDVASWSDAPCVNCGTCIDVCPARLQVQLIGRYAEFNLFERTEDLHIDACIDCGLCAWACTARRPLLQLIRLARGELAAARALDGPS